MSRRLRPLAALVLAASICAGCGADPAPDAGTGATGKATPRTKAVRFSACMREHGVDGFPDPGPSGELTVDGVVNGSSLDPDGPVWTAAIKACKRLEPAGFTGRRRSTTQQSGALRFAQCIREHGVEDFPDPAVGDPLIDTRRIPSSDTPAGMATLDAAMEACRDASEAAGVTAP